MKRFTALGGITLVFLSGIFSSFAFAGEMDILLDKLVEKDILTPVEAQGLKDETQRTRDKEMPRSFPVWVNNMRLKGDLRVRYQYQRDRADTEARERGRIRYRLGIMTKTGDVDVGAGLASGGADPRSTNQTFSDTFASGDLRLDYAYVKYRPSYMDNMEIVAGKFKRKPYLWAPTDMLWDGDINPTGGALRVQGGGKKQRGNRWLNNLQYAFNTGVWVMDENNHSDKGAPFLYYTQVELQYKEEKMKAIFAGTYYGFNNVQNRALDYSAGTNSGATTGLQYDYDSFGVSAELALSDMFGGLPLGIDEQIAFFTDYVMNVDRDIQQRHGWAFGTKLGNKKVNHPGTWQLKYQFVNLQKDAFLDTFPDSDRYSGGTDVRSHEVVLNYALRKNVILGVDYYQSDWIKNAKDLEHLVQLDLMVKF